MVPLDPLLHRILNYFTTSSKLNYQEEMAALIEGRIDHRNFGWMRRRVGAIAFQLCLGRYFPVKQPGSVVDPGFPRRGVSTPLGKNLLFVKIFAKNCMKMKEIGPRGDVRNTRFTDLQCFCKNIQVPRSFQVSRTNRKSGKKSQKSTKNM